MKHINIFYLHNGFQFTDDVINQQFEKGWLGRKPLSLEELTQVNRSESPFFYDDSLFTFDFVYNGDFSKLSNDAVTLVPFDYQSVALSRETQNISNTTVKSIPSDFGLALLSAVDEICSLNLPNLVLLFYSSTEPFYFTSNIYFYDIAKKYPHAKIVLSGSGQSTDMYDRYNTYLAKLPNVTIIPKLWYLDRVHYMTFISPHAIDNVQHLKLNETTPPDDVSSLYKSAQNRFLYTVRNCRSHRVLFSSMWENTDKQLSDTTYARFFSMHRSMINSMDTTNSNRDSFKYYVELVTTTVSELQQEEGMTDALFAQCMKTIYSRPHLIDMTSFDDKGIPGAWLYADCDLVIAPGGEALGYGYVDEKQYIPMLFKKPFITFGCKGLYEELQRIDFKTFDECWPVSFNTEPTLIKRVNGCINVLEYIRSLDNHHWSELMEKAKPSVDFNYTHAKEGTFRIPSNNQFFQGILEHASN